MLLSQLLLMQQVQDLQQERALLFHRGGITWISFLFSHFLELFHCTATR